MAIVQPKSLKYRKAAAHVFMLFFLCLIMFPLLMIVAISFRQGNYSVGDVIPKFSTSTLDHWRLALGFDVKKLNRIPGSVVNFVNTDDGKVQMYVSTQEDDSFRAFISDAFDPEDVKKVESLEDAVEVSSDFNVDQIDSEKLEDADSAFALCKTLAHKIVVKVGEGDSVTRYLIDKNDKDGTSYGIYKETITPPPFPVLRWLWNSVKVAFITSFLIICLSTTSAYAFARITQR